MKNPILRQYFRIFLIQLTLLSVIFALILIPAFTKETFAATPTYKLMVPPILLISIPLIITGLIYLYAQIFMPWYMNRLLNSKPFNLLKDKGFFYMPEISGYHYKDSDREILICFSISTSGTYEISIGIEAKSKESTDNSANAQLPSITKYNISSYTKRSAMKKILEYIQI